MGRTFLIALIMTVAVVAAPMAHADDVEYTEYEIKAGFMYNIAKFVEWPEGSADTRKPLVLCVLGTDPFGKALDDLNGRPVGGRRLEVRRASSLKDLKDCHMLFISGSEKERLPRILEALRDSAILTIGDTTGYAGRGVMVNFYLDQKKLRIEINIDKAKRARLLISSQLLRLTRIVQSPQ